MPPAKPSGTKATAPATPPAPPPTTAQRLDTEIRKAVRTELRDAIPKTAAGTGAQVKVGPLHAPVIPLLLVGIGGYLCWFAVSYWRMDRSDVNIGSGTLWPSDPIKSALQGKGLPSRAAITPESALLTTYLQQNNPATTDTTDTSGNTAGTPVASGAAQNTAKLLLSKFGWAVSELGPLIKLWNQESGWNSQARNPSSGAYGIAQALGHGQADTAAPDGTNEYGAQYGLTAAQAQQANAGSVTYQILWGLGYIKSEYGSPSAAWAHEQADNYY